MGTELKSTENAGVLNLEKAMARKQAKSVRLAPSKLCMKSLP